MRVVIASLLRAVPAMVNELLVMILAWIVFGIVGVQLFSVRVLVDAAYYGTMSTLEELTHNTALKILITVRTGRAEKKIFIGYRCACGHVLLGIGAASLALYEYVRGLSLKDGLWQNCVVRKCLSSGEILRQQA